MATLIDIGANLTHASFDADRDALIERAHEAGVTQMILTGSCLSSSEAALALTNEYPDTFRATAGFHPHHAKDYTPEAHSRITELLAQDNVVAVGECGLDFNRNFSPKQTQQDVFDQHLDLAKTTQLPLFLHQRDAHDAFMELFAPRRDQFSTAVVHCFTGNAQELDDYLGLDCHIGITGWICDERRGQHLQDLVKRIPANRLMIETDAPYLLPRNLKPKPSHRRNEPMYLKHIAEFIAACRDQTFEQLATQTTENARAFFKV